MNLDTTFIESPSIDESGELLVSLILGTCGAPPSKTNI